MLGGYESFSLRRKSRIKPVLRAAGVVALVFLLYKVIATVGVFSVRVDSVSMQPALARGDVVLATPLAFGIPIGLLPSSLQSYGVPHRGDLVVFESPGAPSPKGLARVGEALLRFFTLNRRSVAKGPDGRPMPRFSIKRVIGLPGDTVRMERLQAYIRPAGHIGFQPERELLARSYAVDTRLAVDWPVGFPFAGDAPETTLGAGEYFVLGDNRAHSSDSRSWGVVEGDRVRGRTLFRYWPVTRLGRPQLSLYVHVPFCIGKCSYCDFYSVTDLGNASRVVQAIIDGGARALDRLGRPRLATVYVGGGTPSALSRPDLARLLHAIREWCRGEPDELTVEANPETVDEAFLEICTASAVSRLSVGVQTLDPRLLRLLGRRATTGQTLAALALIANRWKAAVSVDLLAGIPGQTSARLAADLDAVLGYSPAHVSLYSLTREAGTPYDRAVRSGRLPDMAAEEQERVWLAGVKLLRDRGYKHYEISNFALRGGECLHNEHYWRLDPYLGIGPAAVSTLPGGSTGVVRVTQGRSVAGYLAGEPPRIEEIGARDFLFENLMMGLRLERGVAEAAVRGRFGDPALEWLRSAWDRMREQRGTRLRGGRLALTRRGWLLLSALLTGLLADLESLHLDGPPAWPDGPSSGLARTRS